MAIDDATLLFVSKQDFQALCLAHPQVPLKVLKVVGARLRRLVGIIEELSFTTVRHRLASYLLRLGQKSGKRSAEGVEVTLPITNQELAAQIGTVRELVSRNLSRLQAEGMLKIDGRNVTLCNLKALEEEIRRAVDQRLVELGNQMLGSKSKYSSSSFFPPSPAPRCFSDSINSMRSIHLTIL
jgi:hypothetical protein